MARRDTHSETTSHGLRPLPQPLVLQDQNALTRSYSTPPAAATAVEPEPSVRPGSSGSDTDTLRAHDSDVMPGRGGNRALDGDSTRTSVRRQPDAVPVARPARHPARRLSATEHDGVIAVRPEMPMPMRRRTLLASVLAGLALPGLIVVAMAVFWRSDPVVEQATRRAEAAAFHMQAADLALAQQRLPEVRVHLAAARQAGAAADANLGPALKTLDARLVRAERLQALSMAVYSLETQVTPEPGAITACQREAQALAEETGLSASDQLVLERLRASITALHGRGQASGR